METRKYLELDDISVRSTLNNNFGIETLDILFHDTAIKVELNLTTDDAYKLAKFILENCHV